jgi:hypothetical protein
MSALATTGGDLASVLGNISQQMVENVPVSVLRSCLEIVQNRCEVINELTGELDNKKVALLRSKYPGRWTDAKVEITREVEHWKWQNAMALAERPAEIRQISISLSDARMRAQGASAAWREQHKARVAALEAEYQQLCKQLNWSE